MAWLRLSLMAILMLVTPRHSIASSMAKHGCTKTCGKLTIPYPFGIGPDCYREGFEVACDRDLIFLHNASSNIVIPKISLSEGQVTIMSKLLSWRCYDQNGPNPKYNDSHVSRLPLDRSVFTISSKRNKFTTVGCDSLAVMVGLSDHHTYAVSACVSRCNATEALKSNDQCSGIGCCESSIPRHLAHIETQLDIAFFNHSNTWHFNPCGYAFVVEDGEYRFEASDLKGNNMQTKYKDGIPVVLDWVAGKESCNEARQDKSSYACIGKNSQCINSTNANGYLCKCFDGYEGNPYLEEGCQDINECLYQYKYPCHGICKNTIGNYNCTCKPGTSSRDPKKEQCDPITGSGGARQTRMAVGISASIILLLVCIFGLLIACQRRKLIEEKERFFQQNGGLLLYEQIRSKQVDTVGIFTEEELEKATNHFDKSRELGKGGHGTVYKGILKDNRVVAVKRSKIVNLIQKDEFVQEIIILSQINHRNVVRLLGCCLEVEVPMLVYEFIPNGTLFQLIHGYYRSSSISLDSRLRIAQESTEALAYLHSSASPPIVHGDVKSPNILLGDNNMAKVTDFGASRILPKDAIQFMTVVQGTLGYLDPEYLQERQLTEKSDVYSFGVVLLELITRKTAIYSEGPEEGKSLASSFLLALKENRLQDILDRDIMSVGMELLQEIAELAKQCLSLTGEERPLMIEVVDKLKVIRNTWREVLMQHTADETECLLQNSSVYDPYSTGRRKGLVALDLEAADDNFD